MGSVARDGSDALFHGSGPGGWPARLSMIFSSSLTVDGREKCVGIDMPAEDLPPESCLFAAEAGKPRPLQPRLYFQRRPSFQTPAEVRAVTGRGGSRQEGCSAQVPAGVITSAHNSRCDKKSAHASPHGSWQCIICARLSHGA